VPAREKWVKVPHGLSGKVDVHPSATMKTMADVRTYKAGKI